MVAAIRANPSGIRAPLGGRRRRRRTEPESCAAWAEGRRRPECRLGPVDGVLGVDGRGRRLDIPAAPRVISRSDLQSQEVYGHHEIDQS